MAGDLTFLRTRLPHQLRVLDLSQNKFHTVATLLPDSLHVLKLAHNATLGKLNRDEEVLFMLATERSVHRHGDRVRRLRVIAADNAMVDQMLEMLNRDD
ncbi:hypothetical protein GGF31_007303 [Allomyces arbusculus]|nr:hypothetical protein GGF31_007303 [Allomyces arbusculus]